MTRAEFDWRMRWICKQASTAIPLLAGAILARIVSEMLGSMTFRTIASTLFIAAVCFAIFGRKPVDPKATVETDVSVFD